MVIVGTPNHGTHSVLKYMDYIPRVGEITMALKFNSPGTKDLCPYDDQAWFPFLSGNPTLYCLNRSPKCIPLADMTLIAGTHGFLCSRFLLGENDKVVTVDSVFCRTDKKMTETNRSWSFLNRPKSMNIRKGLIISISAGLNSG